MQKILGRDDSVENSMGGGHTLGQKLLEQKLLGRDDSVENSIGVKLYPGELSDTSSGDDAPFMVEL